MSTPNTHSANLSQKFAMARFAEPHLASAPDASSNSSPLLIGSMASSFDGSRALTGLLLAAVIAALLVVADQLIETWTDGHLLAAWVALWTVAIAALALLATPLRHMTTFAVSGWGRGLHAWRTQRDEARMWELASHDPRVLEDIRAAVARSAD